MEGFVYAIGWMEGWMDDVVDFLIYSFRVMVRNGFLSYITEKRKKAQ